MLAKEQVECVKDVSRALRTPATHLMAVFLQDIGHESWTCVARFFCGDLSNAQAWMMVDAIELAVKEADPKAVLKMHGCGADGAFSFMLDGRDGEITNLTQLANAASAAHAKFKQSEEYTDASTKKHGIRRATVLWSRWRAAKVRGVVAQPRRAKILGMGSAMPQGERQASLARWAASRRERKPKAAFTQFLVERCRGGATPRSVLYGTGHDDAIPAEERVLLDAMRALEIPARRAEVWTEEETQEECARWQGSQKPYEFTAWQGDSPEDAATHASFDRGMKILYSREGGEETSRAFADITDPMEEACKRAAMDELLQKHPNLSSHIYCPATKAGLLQIFVECSDHKLKNFFYGILGQKEGEEQETWPIVCSELLVVARKYNCLGAEAVLTGANDKQEDLVYRALVVDEDFKQALLKEGLFASCLVLDIVGELFEAFNMPGLTLVERIIRHYHFAFLNFCLWGEDLFLPSNNKGDAFKQRRGLVPDSLLAMHANCDAIMFLLEHLPEPERLKFCDRCFSNVYDCELYFSLLVQRCGYKPDALTAEGAFHNIDALAAIKKMRDRPFWISMSNSKHYDHKTLTDSAMKHWNSGSRIDPKCDAYKAWTKELVARAEKKCDKPARTVREHYK